MLASLLFCVFCLTSGHIFKARFASYANQKKQKNGWQKNGDQSACGFHFSARHFSAGAFTRLAFANVS
jgi:hypothetical protein